MARYTWMVFIGRQMTKLARKSHVIASICFSLMQYSYKNKISQTNHVLISSKFGQRTCYLCYPSTTSDVELTFYCFVSLVYIQVSSTVGPDRQIVMSSMCHLDARGINICQVKTRQGYLSPYSRDSWSFREIKNEREYYQFDE